MLLLFHHLNLNRILDVTEPKKKKREIEQQIIWKIILIANHMESLWMIGTHTNRFVPTKNKLFTCYKLQQTKKKEQINRYCC